MNVNQKEFEKQRNLILKHESLFKSLFDLPMREFYGKDVITMQEGFDIVKFENTLKEKHPEMKDADIGALLAKHYKTPNDKENKSLWLILQLL